MSNIKKEVHIRIDCDIAKVVEERANKHGCSNNYEYNKLLKYSLVYEDIISKLNIMNSILDKTYKNSYYIKKLLDQVYADLSLSKKDVKTSVNLIEFKETLKKNKGKFIE